MRRAQNRSSPSRPRHLPQIFSPCDSIDSKWPVTKVVEMAGCCRLLGYSITLPVILVKSPKLLVVVLQGIPEVVETRILWTVGNISVGNISTYFWWDFSWEYILVHIQHTFSFSFTWRGHPFHLASRNYWQMTSQSVHLRLITSLTYTLVPRNLLQF